MNPHLLRAIAVERMDEIARNADRRRRMGELPARRTALTTADRRPGPRRPSLRASLRRLQPGALR
jgi:hypothetical protein